MPKFSAIAVLAFAATLAFTFCGQRNGKTGADDALISAAANAGPQTALSLVDPTPEPANLTYFTNAFLATKCPELTSFESATQDMQYIMVNAVTKPNSTCTTCRLAALAADSEISIAINNGMTQLAKACTDKSTDEIVAKFYVRSPEPQIVGVERADGACEVRYPAACILCRKRETLPPPTEVPTEEPMYP